MKKIFLGLMACAALCACTSDDLVSLGNETQKVFEGDVAYMTVRLQDVGANTRATTPAGDESFSPGSASEYAVSTADFYFYDADGVFVSEADIWDGGNATTSGDGKYPNVEFVSNTVVVLKGLTSKNYPNYVVTVLNKPTNFQPGETLTEMASLLANATDAIYTSVTGSSGTATNYFVMSTSSYDAGTTGAPAFSYFATPVPESAFYEEPIVDDLSKLEDVVDIYVERLAAKATVGVSSEMTNSTTTVTIDGTNYTAYEIDETVAGDPNEETGDNTGIAAEKIYVAFLGWTTNAIARNSYMMKNINTSWTNTAETLGTGWTWNDATNFRSYWGMSWNYGDENADYPLTSGGNYPKDEAEPTTWLNDYLLYKNLADPTALSSSACEYFGENTNTPEVLGSKYSSGITHVLLKAVVCDADGKALDLVRYHGELFEKDAFLNYVMNELNYTNKLNIYTKTTVGTEDVYTQIDCSYVMLVNRSNGIVDIKVAKDEEGNGPFKEEETYYSKGDNGTYTAITGTGTSAEAAEALLATALEGFCEDQLYDANAFVDGLMYYSIPIEHLNNTYPAESTTPSVNEANYGVVRNHWYRLTVTSVENLGKGIFDPDEVIVPNPEEEPLYYIGADINILSWKLVDQSVSL